MSKFSKGGSYGNCVFGIHGVEGSNFCFGGRPCDSFDDLCSDGNRTIIELFVSVTHEEQSAGVASSFGCNKVGSITIDVEDHVAPTIEHGVVRVTATVVEEVLDCLHGFLCARVGVGGKVIQCMEHGAVKLTGIV